MKAYYQNDPRLPVEHCALCDEPTGRAGRDEDSLYAAACTPAEIGPLCETCYETLTQATEIDRLRAEVERLRGEREDAIQEEAIARGAEADRMNAAARMAAALKDLYNECGDINEVAAAYLSVAEDVDHYQYLGESEEEMRQRLREQDARRRLAEEKREDH